MKNIGKMENKETLEEAARDYIKGDDLSTFSQRSFFIAGAKWQADRMYSEEEVEQLIHRAVHDSHCRSNRVKHANSNECAAFVNKWLIEQFKK